MGLFKRQSQFENPNLELVKIVIKSRLLDGATLQHLAAIIGTCGKSGDQLKTDWPNEQQIAVHETSSELAKKLFRMSVEKRKFSVRDCAVEVQQTIDELTEKLTLDSFEHVYQAPLIFALSELVHRKRSDLSYEQIEVATEVVLTIIIGIKWFPKWSEEFSDSINERLSFANQGAIDRNTNVISKVIMKEEIALNAGASYMLNQGSMGDGTLIVTDKRLIFVFDEDYKKTPKSFLFSNFKGFNFTETSVVPMSKELTIQFSDFGLDQSVAFYVGNFYCEELANLFRMIS